MEDHLAEEGFADREEFLAEWSNFLDHGRIETFEDVRIGFEGHGEEFLEFPIAGLGGVVLELFGRAEERPLKFGGREVNTAAIGVGIVGIEAVSA